MQILHLVDDGGLRRLETRVNNERNRIEAENIPGAVSVYESGNRQQVKVIEECVDHRALDDEHKHHLAEDLCSLKAALVSLLPQEIHESGTVKIGLFTDVYDLLLSIDERSLHVAVLARNQVMEQLDLVLFVFVQVECEEGQRAEILIQCQRRR